MIASWPMPTVGATTDVILAASTLERRRKRKRERGRREELLWSKKGREGGID